MYIRKSLISIAFVLPAVLYAQKSGIGIGVGAGNLYKVNRGQELLPNYQYLVSYSIDYSRWIKISDNLWITTGAGLASISTKYENPLSLKGQEHQKERLTLIYIKLPAKFKFKVGNKFIPHFGPSFSYRIQDKVKNSQGYHHLFDSKFDYGLDLGFGLRISSSTIAGLNVYNGFGNVEKIACGNCSATTSEASRIRTFELNFNYILN